jgi:hypothetical protein
LEVKQSAVLSWLHRFEPTDEDPQRVNSEDLDPLQSDWIRTVGERVLKTPSRAGVGRCAGGC